VSSNLFDLYAVTMYTSEKLWFCSPAIFHKFTVW